MPEPGRLFALSEVLRAEIEAIAPGERDHPDLRHLRRLPAVASDDVQEELWRRRVVYRRAHDIGLAALCLSGGGIRSASCCLGVIQRLAEAGLLTEFDYLSTVSGGGYIGSWLSAWLHWDGDSERVVRALGSRRAVPDQEPEPVSHLRAYSSYLTPRLGVFSADTWAALTIVLRNMLLNWLLLVPALCLPVIAVKMVAAIAHTAQLVRPHSRWAAVAGGTVAVLCLIGSAVAFGYKLYKLYGWRTDRKTGAAQRISAPHGAREQTRFLQWHMLPAIVAGAAAAWLANEARPGFAAVIGTGWGGWASVAGAAVLAYLAAAAGTWLKAPRLGWERRDFFAWMVAALVWATLAWLGVWLYRSLPVDLRAEDQLCGRAGAGCAEQVYLVVFGLPWFLLSMLLSQTVYVLLRSYSRQGDFEREWLGRAGGWHLIAALSWVVLAGLVLLGPYLYYDAAALSADFGKWVAGLGTVSGVVTAVLGKSSLSPAQGSATGWAGIASNIGLAIAGPLFAAILVIVLSLGIDALAFGHALRLAPIFVGSPHVSGFAYWSNWLWLVGIAVGLAAVMLSANSLVNVNRFSLHAVYRNRLVRAFLGGSRGAARHPDGFTGFDENDNFRVAALWDGPRQAGNWRPYHVINITLNLASTRKLAWQQRKAESFTVTPKFSGSAQLGYRRTREYGDPDGGISLGTAMAISGAAVSPNMGYHSSPSIAFLLTMFNMRLGWWLGNPGEAGAKRPDGRMLRLWRSAARPGLRGRWAPLGRLDRRIEQRAAPYSKDAPRLASRPILAELLGLTNERSPYVYLSDGGHFEDLGLYEMVRRRCRWIVVVDAAEDAGRTFEDLGNAVRKIAIDLGVRIVFPNAELLAATAETPRRDLPYFALGTIEYVSDAGSGEAPRIGRILFIKPAVRGDEAAADIIAYGRANTIFPNQSTLNQWFDEPQLESYRALGYLMVDRILAAAPPRPGRARIFDALFAALDGLDPQSLGPRNVTTQ